MENNRMKLRFRDTRIAILAKNGIPDLSLFVSCCQESFDERANLSLFVPEALCQALGELLLLLDQCCGICSVLVIGCEA